MIIYDNTNNTNISEFPNGKKHFLQRFNANWFPVCVQGIDLNVMLNSSNQIINENNILEKEILNYFAFIDTKYLKMDIYIDIDYRIEDKVLNNEELNEAIKKELFKQVSVKEKERKELERKNQKAYFAKKRAMDKKIKQKEEIYEKYTR
jgi:hypothetical protein